MYLLMDEHLCTLSYSRTCISLGALQIQLYELYVSKLCIGHSGIRTTEVQIDFGIPPTWGEVANMACIQDNQGAIWLATKINLYMSTLYWLSLK